ncbi:MAG: putative AlkP superfamily phosphohydrolase/phosphomutase [Chlamydiales bacterium]|jgi:predicted AlkP superfamily phosphohydrolase/phosphomutase
MSLTRVLVVAIDAADKDLILEWAQAGLLPTFQSLFESAAWGKTSNPAGLYVGAVWPSFFTGVSPTRHRRYASQQLCPGSYENEHFRPSQVKGEPFWNGLTRSRKRVAIIDVPKTVVSEGLNGMHVVDWLSHDGDHAGFQTWPSTLSAEIVERFGPADSEGCNADRTTAADFEQLRDGLNRRIERKRALSDHYLRQGDWDLFLTVFAEAHCVGHQCWHIHDSGHPRHDPRLKSIVGNPMRDVYRSIDSALGDLLATVGRETPVLVLASHGMGPHYDGSFMLEQVLRQLDHSAQSRVAQRLRSAWRRLPIGFRSRLTKARERATVSFKGRARCFRVPNNDVYGAIRINLVGREPHGTVNPGPECEALCDELARDLLEIVHLDTGAPAVRRVLRTADLYDGEVDHLPDLLVEWNREAPFSALHSPKMGTVRDVYAKCRTGDHKAEGLFFLSAPWVDPGEVDRPVSVMDFAPTIAELLDVDIGQVEGRSLLSLVRRT